MMIQKMKPNRARDMIGVVMLVVTALLLWAQTSDRMTGGEVDEAENAMVVVGAGAPGPHAPAATGTDGICG